MTTKKTPAVELCPLCGANLQGEPIPTEYLKYYSGLTHYSRLIGISEHDRVVCWRCPDCGGEWPRK